MNHVLELARGRVRRWLLFASLGLAATAVLAAGLGVFARLHGGSDSAGAAGPTVFTRAFLSSLSIPGAPATAPASAPAAPPPTAGPGAEFIWPVEGWIVQGMWAGHPSGIDIGAAMGEPVLAVRDGKVYFAGGDPCCSYGTFIIIQHDDGWSSLYGHMGTLDVRAGDDVKQGDRIGTVGMTGHATGPHVHFELRSSGGVVDPLSYLWPLRVAPPPPPPDGPVYAAAPPGNPGPEGVPLPPQPTPEAHNGGLSASEAIGAAVPWLASNADASYELDPGSCSATPSGPNWIVSCRADLQGCPDPSVCGTTLMACVLSQPLLVASTC